MREFRVVIDTRFDSFNVCELELKVFYASEDVIFSELRVRSNRLDLFCARTKVLPGEYSGNIITKSFSVFTSSIECPTIENSIEYLEEFLSKRTSTVFWSKREPVDTEVPNIFIEQLAKLKEENGKDV